jgi:hypothetical protein
MRHLVLVFLFLVLATTASSQAYPPYPGYPSAPLTQSSMACGNGVVIRADGSVMIDEWRGYDATNTGQPRLFPTSVTLGKSIKGPTNVCVEFDNGTLCGDIGKLRALIEKNFKPASSTK